MGKSIPLTKNDVIRRGDSLGRIVIPKELRKKYGLEEGADISFEDSGIGILVRASDNLCALCKGALQGGRDIRLCDGCIEEIIKEYKNNKDK